MSDKSGGGEHKRLHQSRFCTFSPTQQRLVVQPREGKRGAEGGGVYEGKTNYLTKGAGKIPMSQFSTFLTFAPDALSLLSLVSSERGSRLLLDMV